MPSQRRFILARKAFSAIAAGECALLLALAIATSGAAALGATPFAITTGSMEPALPIGGLVWACPEAPEELGPGAVIAFDGPDGLTVIHRIQENRPHDRVAVTKGDANGKPDPAPVPYEAIKGKVTFHVPVLGSILLWLQAHRFAVMVALIGFNGGLAAAAAAVSIAKRTKGDRNGENRNGIGRTSPLLEGPVEGGRHPGGLRGAVHGSGNGLLHSQRHR